MCFKAIRMLIAAAVSFKAIRIIRKMIMITLWGYGSRDNIDRRGICVCRKDALSENENDYKNNYNVY